MKEKSLLEELSPEEKEKLRELEEVGYQFLRINKTNEGWVIIPSRKKYLVAELLILESQRLEFGNTGMVDMIKALEFYRLKEREIYAS